MLSVVLLVGCFGCSTQDDESAPVPVATAENPINDDNSDTAAAGAADIRTGGRTTIEGLSFDFPCTWERQNLRPAQLGIIAAAYQPGGPASNVRLTLSRVGGGIEDNLARWEQQFAGSSPDRRGEFSAGSLKGYLLDISGRFSGMFGGADEATAEQRMLGVLFDLNTDIYSLKLIGPAPQVDAVAAEFEQFARSARQEGP